MLLYKLYNRCMFMLKSLRMETGLTRADLSRAVNINQGTLANYENEIRQADYKTLILLAEYFDVTVDYLLGRDGMANEITKQAAPDASPKPLSQTEKELLSRFRKLSTDSREIVLNLAKNLNDLAENKK